MFWNRKNEVPHDAMPIHHDRHSAFYTTAGNVAGEGLKGTAKGAVTGLGAGALLGAALFVGLAILLMNPGIIVAGIQAVGTAVGGITGLSVGGGFGTGLVVIGAGIAGAMIGGVKGLFTGGIIGGLFGAGHGLSKGREQVAQERMTAQAVDQQLGAAQMQSQAMLMQAQAARSPFPPQGSAMNMASSKIDASGAEHSKLAERQLQMA
jgi:hypothetical protein